jgi:hypothetical protein
MLPEAATRERLAVLALFERLGFDEDVAPETQIVCVAFSLDETEFRRSVYQEEGRYVSAAGRYCLITPRLFAVWLAQGYMQGAGVSIAESLRSLPPTLVDAFLNQMEAFAGDEIVAAVIADILDGPPFRDRELINFDASAARLLQIAALVDPQLATEKVRELFLGWDLKELSSFGSGRRNLIHTLEFLAWLPESFDVAVKVLFDLACAENETWANNATGVFSGLFAIHLGGTSVPHLARLEWLRDHYRDRGSAGIPIAIRALEQALSIHEFRTEGSYGSRILPTEWRPQTVDEEMEARRASWRLLIETANLEPNHRSEVAQTLGQSMQMVIARGLGDDVISGLRQVEWSSEDKARLAEGILASLRYGAYAPEYRQRLEGLLTELRGRSLDEAIETVLPSSVWDLAESEEEAISDRPPNEIIRLVEQLAEQPVGYIAEIAARSIEGDEQTTFVLFRELGQTPLGELALEAVKQLRPVPAAALVGLFIGASQILGDEWADDQLQQWLSSPEVGKLIPQAAHMLAGSPKRVEVSLEAVERGYCDAMELGRFILGAWTKDLPEPAFVQLLKVLVRSENPAAVENALGMLGQWLNQGHVLGAPFVSFAEELLEHSIDAVRPRGHSMGPFYRRTVMQKLNLSFDARLRLCLRALNRASFPDQNDLAVLDELCRERPQAAVDGVVPMIIAAITSRDPSLRALWLQQGHLLSRLEASAGPEVVVNSVLRQSKDLWPELIAHLNLDTATPDPVLTAMIERSEDSVLWSRASFSFMYPSVGWFGSESSFLEGRQRLAEAWLQRAASDAFRSWITNVIRAIGEHLQEVRRREAEGRS